METKVCTQCEQEFPATSKYFYSNKKGKDGLSSWCKKCTNDKKKEYRERDPEKLEEYRAKKRVYQKKYISEHPEKKQEYNEQQKIERARKRRKKLRDRISHTKHKDKHAIKSKEYYRTPKGRFIEYRRRGKRDDIEFNLTLEEFTTFWNLPCHYCGDPIDGIGLDRTDNTKGYFVENCVACCINCNRMKASKPLMEWLGHISKVLSHMEELVKNANE
jgi:hypothetical protein